MRKISLALLWLGLGIYALMFAPPEQGDSLALIVKLSTGQWGDVNPLIVALFNLMGIWPMIYAAVLLADGRSQAIPAWPFVGGSFAMGVFALLPYLVLRQAAPAWNREQPITPVLRFWDSRGLAMVMGWLAIAWLTYGLLQGDWQDFWIAWHRSRFIHVMSLDFCCLCLLFPSILGADLARRGLCGWQWWGLASIPLFGPLAYLNLRSPLDITQRENQDERPHLASKAARLG